MNKLVKVIIQRQGAIVFAMAFLVYLSLPKYTGSLDTVPQISLPLSLLQTGDLYFEEMVIESPEKDPHWFTNSHDGRVISSYPIAPGLLNTPLVIIYAMVFGIGAAQTSILTLSQISAALISALAVLFLHLYLVNCRRYHQKVIWATTIAFSFCTAVWSVTAGGLWNQTASLFFISFILYLSSYSSRPIALCIGLVLAAAFFNRMSNAFIYGAILLPFIRQHRHLWKALLLGVAIGSLPWITYNLAFFGTMLQTNYGGHHRSLSSFNSNFLEGLLGVIISPSRGLLIYSPLFILSFLQIAHSLSHWREEFDRFALSLAILLTIGIYGIWGMWWGGHSFGYRIISDLSAPLMLLFADFINAKQQRPWLWAVCLTLMLMSSLVHALGAFRYPCGFNTTPQNIDRSKERLWDLKDNQISRCLFK